MQHSIVISVELTDQEAWDLAEFLKRARLDTFRAFAQDDAEAQGMREAAEKVRRALALADVQPR